MLKELLGTTIVIDTPHALQYIGVLQRFDAEFLELADADIHDFNTSKSTTKDQYLIEAAKGILHPNRKKVFVKQSIAISISKLEDILVY